MVVRAPVASGRRPAATAAAAAAFASAAATVTIGGRRAIAWRPHHLSPAAARLGGGPSVAGSARRRVAFWASAALPPPPSSPPPASSDVGTSTTAASASAAAAGAPDTPLLTPPSDVKPAWRPSREDVLRLSRGQAAKARGTGSRAVPHRLNAEEVAAFQRACRSGVLVTRGGGARRERKGSPLGNTWRAWCDAAGGVPAVGLRKAADGIDTVVVDLSPLRAEPHLPSPATLVPLFSTAAADAAGDDSGLAPPEVAGIEALADPECEWATAPIWSLPDVTLVWTAPRPVAKAIASAVVAAWATVSDLTTA
ncbi:hypothetical protein MMPV_004614 [Pyropia vietnamensis]